MTSLARSCRIPSRSSSLPSSKFPQTCVCGTTFIADSLFCRKCGERRAGSDVAPADASSESRRLRVNESVREYADREPRTSPHSDCNRPLRQNDTSFTSEALRRKEKQLSDCRSELVTARAEAKRAVEEISKHDASIKGLREQASMWEQEVLEIRGRLAAAEAEAHRERGILEGEASRLRLARDDARGQAELLQADCNERLARKHAELQDALAEIERLGTEKDNLLEERRKQKELLDQIEEERKRDARVHAQELELSRQRNEALEVHNHELEGEISRLRDALKAAESKMRTISDSHALAERRNSTLSEEIFLKSQALEDQEKEAKERLVAHEQRIQQRADRRISEERLADALKLEEARRESFAEIEVKAETSWRSRVSDELDTAKREEAAQDTTLGASFIDAHWADSPLMIASPLELQQMSTHSHCACGSAFLFDSVFCAKCGKKRPSSEDIRQDDHSPDKSPRSPRSLWNSLRSPELRPSRGEAQRRVSFLEEQLSQTNEREQDALKSVTQEGEAWRHCRERLEERLERMSHDRSREQDIAREERVSALLSHSYSKQHESTASRARQELHDTQQKLHEVRSREASFADSSHQQRSNLEARLENAERDRDRLLEATNELRADLRSLSQKKDGHESKTADGREVRGSDAVRALQQRYSAAKSEVSPSSSPKYGASSRSRTSVGPSSPLVRH